MTDITVALDYNDNIDENEALARAIAESQQDYINQVLKKNWDALSWSIAILSF